MELGCRPFAENEYGTIVDYGDAVLLPYSSDKKDNSVTVKYITVDKTTGQRIKNTPFKTENVPVPASVCYDKRWIFGDKEIRCNTNERFIKCWSNDNILWKFTTWAWLYTEIIEKNGCIIFGTDGMGGRLYCLELETGKLISETKTQHSAFYDFRGFNWYNDNVVVYAKGVLAVVNPFTGEVVDNHKIPTKYPYRGLLKVLNGYAYCYVMTDNNHYSVICFVLDK